MKVLRDEELRLLIESQAEPLLEPIPKIANWEDDKSPVQPASIDLHVGKIFVPGQCIDSIGKLKAIEDRFVLATGQTAMVQTLEQLRLPSALAGIGFPPSRISGQGILMTNPGHIDPGYRGHLHVTLINMGREPFEVRKGDMIMTLMVIELAAAPKADWIARYGKQSPSKITTSHVERLSPDFVNVQERAKKIADEAVREAEIAIKRAQVWASLIAAALTLVGASLTYYFGVQSKLDLLNQNYTNFDKRLTDSIDTSKKLGDLERRVKELEAQNERLLLALPAVKKK